MVEKMDIDKISSITVQYFSDLHLEMMPGFVIDIPVVADILVLAGDMGMIRQPLTREFFTKVCKKFKDVLYVTGNHEYYQQGFHTNFSNHYNFHENLLL